MKHLSQLIAGIILLLPFSTSAQEYYNAKNNAEVNGNPYYVLPKAAILFQIPLTTTTYKIGEYAKTATFSAAEWILLEKRFGVDKEVLTKLQTHFSARLPVGSKPQESYDAWAINNDSIKVSVLAKPDYSKIFYTNAQKNWNKNKMVSFTYGVDGVLTEGESSIEDKTFDLVVKTLSSVTSIVGSFYKGVSKADKDSTAARFGELEEILQKIEALPQTIRDKDIYKEVKSDLEKKYAKLFSEYFYSEKKKLKISKVYYTPVTQPKDYNAEIDFFTFDTNNGNLQFNKDLSSQLWGMDVTTGPINSSGGIKVYRFKYFMGEENLNSVLNANLMPGNGFAYNIPMQNGFRLTTDGGKKILYEAIIKFPQFGTIGRVYSKKNKLAYSLDPLTGELKKLSVSSSSMTTDQVGSIASTATEVITTAKGDSEATKLEQEVKKLENEKKKRDLLKELNP